MSEDEIFEHITVNCGEIVAWAARSLVLDEDSASGIDELYTAYEADSASQGLLPMPRKVWLAVMKLAGFETQAGRFRCLAMR